MVRERLVRPAHRDRTLEDPDVDAGGARSSTRVHAGAGASLLWLRETRFSRAYPLLLVPTMNVPTLEIDRNVAADRAREYSEFAATMRESREREEFLELAQLHAAAARGRKLILLDAVMTSAPRDAKGRPLLAIARSDRRRLKYTAYSSVDQFSTDYHPRRGRGSPSSRFEFPRHPSINPGHRDGYALVPLVPPAVRMGGNGQPYNLQRCFTLWEVVEWSDREVDVTPDQDPYLLRAITRDVYAIVGEWELTELEQAVLGLRARES